MEAPISALGGAVFKLPVKLDGLLRHGYMLPKGVEDEIPLIKRDLEKIIAILQDHISRLDNPLVIVNCWMKEVRELSYDIEDCIDQYEHAAGSKSKYVCKIPRRKFALRKTNRLSDKLKQRLWMANRIREFSARVQEALQRHELYNLGGIGRTPRPPTPTYDVPSRSPHHIVYGEQAAGLVGIDAPMNKLEELMIKDGEQKLKVVSIVGVGGIGKTILANEIYCKLGGQFDCRAFVRASQKPDMRRLLTSMLSQVRPHQPPDNWKVHNLIAAIRTHLKDKRYLIVADDVWTTSTWDTLNCALSEDNSCSRILITTEIEDVAHKCCGYESKYVFRMKPLGDDDSRKLFFNSVFGPQYECPPELREVSNNIIRKCGGVPLATVTIARLLASQMVKLEQWDYVNKSLGYGLRTSTTLEGMKQVLNLSYDNLPSHLKACMLYLSIYEEDYIIWKDDLVKQWIADGFLCSTEEQDKEEIFGSYFDELVSRRMIQPVRINENDEVLSCVVHHMVLKLITYKSIEENFVIAIDHSQTTTRFADKVRRLSLHFSNTEDAMPPTNMILSQVRTLAFFGVFKCLPSIVEYGLLQVLILHIWGDEDSISFDLTRISKLFRLRYLQVTSNVTLELRTQMRGLQCLETLKIDARASAVPSDIVDLPNLLHLNLPAKTNLPNGIDHMTLLRTLGYFDLSGNSIENVQSLGELTNLQDLQLTYYTVQPDNLKSNMQCLGSILGKLSNLKSLTLVPADGCSDVNILDVSGATSRGIFGDGLSSVSSAPALIQRLELSLRICIFSTVPTWIGHLGKLCILKIGVRELARSVVDVLRGLPALTILSLYVHTKPAERVVFDRAGFSVLKYFKFRCSVAWLKFEAGAMPNLRKLKLGFNAHGADRYSTTMPVGIEHLSGLTEISAKIGSTGAEEPDRRSAESVLSETIKMHPGRPNVNIQCVDRMFGDKDGGSMGTQEEEYITLQNPWEIMDDDSTEQHGVLQKDYREDANKPVHSRKGDLYSTTMPVGIEHLSSLTKISAKIGSTGAEEPASSAESVLSETIKMHQGRPNVNIQSVDWMFGGKDGESMGTQEEEHMTVQLKFICNTLKIPIYMHKTISACNGQPVDVAICKDDRIITSGPLSSVNVEIVALPGDFRPKDNWTAEDFDRQIVISRDGQGSVLEGCCLRTLLNGRQSFDGIRFKEGSSRTRSRQFTLAARVVRGQHIGGLRVHEAFMGPVTVKDRRSEGIEKSYHPKLNDEVYRLKGIAKNGPNFQRLQKGSIMTVQDFLKAYNTNPERLRDILEIKSHRSKCWETMTRHALNCDLGDMQKLRKYTIAGDNVALFFNCVHDLVGAEFLGGYVAKEEFDEMQKAGVDRLKEQAYNELEGIELDYVMKDGRPVKISTSIIPLFPMQDDIQQPNALYQHGTYQAVDNLGLQHMNQMLLKEAYYNIATPVPGASGSDPFSLDLNEERSTQMRVSSAHDGSLPDDGFSWREYNQKDVLGAKHPRVYYHCNSLGCWATKQIQRTDDDPLLFDVVYHRNHLCAQRPRPAASAGAEHSQSSTTESLQGQVTDATISGSQRRI